MAHRIPCLIRTNAVDEIAAVGQMFRACVRINRAIENAVKGAVVGGRNRVELVIVAAHALHAQPEEGLANIVDRVFDRDVA